MRKSVKIVSALLVLVMLMAQVVCMNAAVTKPSFSWSAEQVDHYEKKISAKLNNGKDVTSITIESYKDKNDAAYVQTSTVSVTQQSDDYATVTYYATLYVRPTVEKYVKVTATLSDNSTCEFWYTVGGNSYYNPGSSSGSSNGGVYDGLQSSGSSNNGNYWYSSSSGSNVWEEYDPNKWYGYRDEVEEEKEKYDLYYVTCRSLNVRNGAGTWADRVGSLKRYDTVKVYDIEDGWAVIEYKGHLRFISARYISEY